MASIDVGSNAIRLLVAEFASPGRYSSLASERVPIRLAHSVFLSGRLTAEAMEKGVQALQGFRQKLDGLEVRHYRAVATSAIRESSNGVEFVEQARQRAGIELQTISGFEEARLVHLAVRNKMPLGHDAWMLLDVGGGSVEVSLVDDHGIRWSQTHAIGSVRLLEELINDKAESGRLFRLLEEYISTLRIPPALGRSTLAGLIATGGSIGTMATLSGHDPGSDGISRIPLAELSAIVHRLARMSYRQRIEELGLREDRADVILPAAMLYERVAILAHVDQVVVPHVGVREGVAIDLVDELVTHGAHQNRQTEQLLAGAIALGTRYMFDEQHGVRVGELALSLFDQLEEQHGLGEADRCVLLAAAVTHDVGQYISTQSHHKHSLYLLSHSELPGLSEREMLLVANVARYHRKSEPKPEHEAFAALTDTEKTRVRKLAAILRLADALDRDHSQRVGRVTATVLKGELLVRIEGRGDLLLDRWALEKKAGLFTRVFNLRVRAATSVGGA